MFNPEFLFAFAIFNLQLIDNKTVGCTMHFTKVKGDGSYGFIAID